MSTSRANAAIYFSPEAFSTAGPKLMGRNAAGESFLGGFARHAVVDRFWCYVEKEAHAQPFASAIEAQSRREEIAAVTKAALPSLATVGTLHYPAPGLAQLAWHRALYGDARWSLTGVTHTTASANAMDGLVANLTAPLQPWDAVICTSTAVHGNVRRLLDAERERLAVRLGATRFVEPQLPVIPLGIDTRAFDYGEASRQAARSELGADADTIVVLFTGRLSFHAKAHPLAMYQALEGAAKRLAAGQKVMLVECGWHANAAIEAAFAEAKTLACPSITSRFLDGRVAAHRQTAWAGADVFCSLSDNIQETFGLVPVEAMAAGLPCVVSDWNGYKDTVRDGVDGFRVPTLMAAPGMARDSAIRHAVGIDSYDMYCGETCMLVSVDLAATADAFFRLFTDQSLRRRMGEAGRKRAREMYDWSSIIPQYQDLWRQLAELRAAHGQIKPAVEPWPARMEPFRAFEGYPTHVLSGQTRFELAAADPDHARERFRQLDELTMVRYLKSTLLPGELDGVLKGLAAGPRSAQEITAGASPERRGHVGRALVRLTKLGVLRMVG